MNTITCIIAAALIACVCFFAGCATQPGNNNALVQRVLDMALPADFTGDAHVEHKNVYFDFTIDAGGLKRGEKGWTWSWLRYRRNDRFSNGTVTLGKPPQT